MVSISAIVVLFIGINSAVYCYPNGAPTTACRSMMPGHGVGGQNAPSPFVIQLSKVVCVFWYLTLSLINRDFVFLFY